MNRISTLSFLVATTGLAVFLATSAESQIGPPKQFVALQPGSPGTSQSGHANLSGTIRANQFIGNGSGLTSINASNISSGTLATGLFPVPTWLTGTFAGPILAGINNSSAVGATGVAGSTAANSGVTFGVYGESQSTNGRGVYGQALANSGMTFGLYGLSASNNGYGLFAEANSATGSTYGVYGQSVSSNGTGVFGNAPSGNGANYGGRFVSASLGGTGIFGSATAASGNTVAGRFENASSAGVAVLGLSTATTGSTTSGRFINSSQAGIGLFAHATSSTGATYGGRFEADSDTGTGVFGRVNSNTGIVNGVFGQIGSPDGYGVHGLASGASTGNGAGVFGESAGEQRPGVLGVSNLIGGTWAYGMKAESTNSGNSRNVGLDARAEFGTYNYGIKATASHFGTGIFAFAVDAHSNDFIGIASIAPQPIVANGLSVTPTNKVISASNSIGTAVYGRIFAANALDYGVYGEVQSGYGVFSDGELGATGVKSFVIDHPFDPENRFLKHFCTEGPTPTNAYSGNVVTDKVGRAWVALPNYFEEINKNFRYQLTCVGTFASAIIGREIENNRFEIRTDKPNVKVSWRVEADRNDRWVQEHPAQAEVDKPDFQKGTYLRPELFGQPRQKKTTYDAEAEAVREFQIKSHSTETSRGKAPHKR